MCASVVTRALAIEGVEHVMWLARDIHEAPSEAVLCSTGKSELRFCPGGPLRDDRGESWSVEGALEVIDATVQDGRFSSPAYPDALARVWSALTCPTAGEIALSAAPHYEFIDWGRQAHVGGGSHGSLNRCDSLAPLLSCGLAGPLPERSQWAIRDVASLVLAHFGLSDGAAAAA